AESELPPIAEEHMVFAIEPDDRWQCLALAASQTISDDLPAFLLPCHALGRSGMTDLVDAVRRVLRCKRPPRRSPKVPHVVRSLLHCHECRGDQEWLV